jgi:hypothetical protein
MSMSAGNWLSVMSSNLWNWRNRNGSSTTYQPQYHRYHSRSAIIRSKRNEALCSQYVSPNGSQLEKLILLELNQWTLFHVIIRLRTSLEHSPFVSDVCCSGSTLDDVALCNKIRLINHSIGVAGIQQFVWESETISNKIICVIYQIRWK